MRQTTDLATMRAIYAKPESVSSRARPARVLETIGEYQQTCSLCLRNGDPNCWLCAGNGYVVGNGSAHYGTGTEGWHRGSWENVSRANSRRATMPVSADDRPTDYSTRPPEFQDEGISGAIAPPPFSYDEWQTAGMHVIHGATGNAIGRPRHDEADLSPVARWKRNSRPLVEHRDRAPIECNLPKECGREYPCTRPERHYHVWDWQEQKHDVVFGLHPIGSSAPWDEASGTLTNTPNERRGLLKLPRPVPVRPVPVGASDTFKGLLGSKFFPAVYDGYQSEIPTETSELRRGQSPFFADFAPAFARILYRETSWAKEPMHAAVDQLEPQARSNPGARLNHQWLVQALRWRGQPCACNHLDIIDHLAATAPGADSRGGISREYVARTVLAGARRAYELIGTRSALVAEPPPPNAA